MFSWTLTTAEALLIRGFVISVIIPFIVSYLKRCSWPKWAKLALAVALSIVGGILTLYSTGDLSGGSVVIAVLGVFAASQLWFKSWFTGLGFEAALNPDDVAA